MRLRIVGAACIVLAASAFGVGSAAGADWPSYGKDLSNSRDGGTDGPTPAEVSSMQQAWRFDTSNGDFTGTPVVAGGTVVAGSNAGQVFALDSVTGKLRWHRDADAGINATAAIDTAAGLVFVPIAKKNAPHLLALRLADGGIVWDTTLTTQDGAAGFGSPAVWNGTVYIGTSADSGDNSTMRGAVVALDERTGAVKWNTFMVPPGRDGGPVWSTPAIDPATGRLFVGTGNAYHAPASDMTDSVVALDARTGAVLAHHQATPDDVFSGGGNPAGPDADFGASPNLFTGPGGRKLVGEGQKSGVYWAFDRTTLDPVWSTRVGPGSPAGGVIGSTATDGQRIYGPNSAGDEVWALGLDGTMSWLTSDAGPVNFSAVQVANGVVYNSDFSGTITARDASSGVPLNKFPVGAPSFGGVAIVGKAVYTEVGTQMNGSGSVIAFGDTSRSTPASPPAAGPPAARLRVSVRPRKVRAGKRTRFRIRVVALGRPVAGAVVRLGRRKVTTGNNGVARVVSVLHVRGPRTVRAGKSGFRTSHVRIRVLRPRHH